MSANGSRCFLSRTTIRRGPRILCEALCRSAMVSPQSMTAATSLVSSRRSIQLPTRRRRWPDTRPSARHCTSSTVTPSLDTSTRVRCTRPCSARSLPAPSTVASSTTSSTCQSVTRPRRRHGWRSGSAGLNVVAVRDLAPLDRPRSSDVVVRVATPDELDVVDRLVDEEAVFHAGSPMFRPYRRDDTADAVRAELSTALASDEHGFLIARREGSDVGVVSVGPGLGSPLYVPDGGVYIAATAVLPQSRGSGAGSTLVDAALAWARDHGHLAACLHFTTANATSTSFWTGIGFTPVMAHMRRRLDERILTSRPPA